MKQEIILATRRSALALAQARMVRGCLIDHDPHRTVALYPMSTTGDQRQGWSLEERGGKGLFTRELEEALRDGRADAAVHSAKDLPTAFEDGLVLAGFLPRGAVADVLVLREGVSSPQSLATGSPRRRAQLQLLFPEASFTEIRGNVTTRLEKIAKGAADGTVLALAGLSRLGIKTWPGLTFRSMDLEEMIPAVGQGAIAVQTLTADSGEFSPALDGPTGIAVRLERYFLGLLGGGCHTAFAGHFSAGRFFAFHEEHGRRVVELSGPEEEMRETLAKAFGDWI